jgi:cytochrome P450
MFDTTQIALSDPQFKANPYPVFARLRTEAPVCQVRFARNRPALTWLVTRYDDVVSILRDPRISSDRRRNISGRKPIRMRVLYSIFGPIIDNMLGSDEPDHTRLRTLVHKGFTQKRVEELRNRIDSLTHELAAKLPGNTTFDLVSDYALPIPTTIIAEMLGVPVSDRERFRRWSDALLQSSATSWTGMIGNTPKFFAFMNYIRDLIEQRRRDPKADLISALVGVEEAGDKLTKDELLSMVLLLLIAGYETTVNVIATGTLALLDNPEQLLRLRAKPELIPSAVEELLRYYTPIDFATYRWAHDDIPIAGVHMKKGDNVMAAISSANRDEAQFASPDTLDIARDPNRHIAFGQGIHYCLGAFLARLEAQIAFATLIEHCPALHLAVPRDQIQWRESLLLRGLEQLPLAC